MRILALDLGTKTGWAATANGRDFDTGTATFDVRRGESAGMRYVRFRAWLREMVELVAPEVIVYEQTLMHGIGGNAVEIAAGMATRVQEVSAELSINYASTHGATLKKWTTGRGNAKKPEMMAAVEARWGKKPIDDNEADAIALLFHALEVYEPKARHAV